jgi:outer membrane lipoprotein-sorting protein
MNVRCFHVLVVSVAVLVLPAAADSTDKWIAKARAYLGSENALNAVTSIHFTGTLEAPGDIKLPAEIIFQKPYRQRITYTGPKVIEITALDGYDAWLKRVNAENPVQWQVRLLEAPQVKRLRANTLENLSFYATREMKGSTIEFLGDVTVDGLACVKISFTHSGDVAFVRYFEKSTGRLVKTETENGTEIREEGEVVVKGVRFPKRVINKAPNGNITSITFDKVVVNENFPAEAFAVPSLQPR